MPGSIIFKPTEAKLIHDTDLITKMNPYCVFIVDSKRINSSVCKHGGKNPRWNEAIKVPFPSDESKITVELMDKDMLTKPAHIGSFEFDPIELQAKGKVCKWFALFYKGKPAGDIMMEASLESEEATERAPDLTQPDVVQRKESAVPVPRLFERREIAAEESVKTYIEQRQTIEPHIFMKEVDVVETRAVEQTIEVLEAQKVVKQVQGTEVVPVKKMVEILEPRVVTQEVDVIEPSVVTKTIQVVENVPVKKEIEVIEYVPVMREFETIEPQTFTKQVEIIEQVPVQKTVVVTEPVHVKKIVEFVEPIITTQTLTKEIRPEVIVSEEVATSVGPATYIGEISQKFSQIALSEEEKARYLAMNEEERLKLSEEEKWRWYEARGPSSGDDKLAEVTAEQQ